MHVVITTITDVDFLNMFLEGIIKIPTGNLRRDS